MGQTVSPEEARKLRRRGQFKALAMGLLASSFAMACSFGEIDGSDKPSFNEDNDKPGAVDDNDDGTTDLPADVDGDDDGNTNGGSSNPGVQPSGPSRPSNDPLEAQALGILELNCNGCHGGANLGNMNYITNAEALIANGKVVKGDSDASPIYIALTQQRMPPPAVLEQRPSAGDIEIIKLWIDGLADVEVCSNNGEFVTFDQMYATMVQDIQQQDVNDRPFTRYIGVANAFNSGACGAALEREQYAVLKTVNSISTEPQVRQPKPIDSRGLIYRVDIRDYGWDRAVTVQPGDTKIVGGVATNVDPSAPLPFTDGWEAILNFSQPYAVEFTGDDADQLKQQTNTLVPYLQADAFIAASTTQNLYYALTDAPGFLPALFDQLGVDIDDQTERRILTRAGFSTSGVSKQERNLLRFETNQPGGNFWVSFDFQDAQGKQNASIYSDPLGADAAAAGGEMIYSLPNGMMAFYVAANDATGTRLTEAPTDVVVDPTQVKNNGAVTNGVSCNGCHQRGMIQFTDKVRDWVTDNQLDYDQQTYEDVMELYPTNPEMLELINQDNVYFQASLKASGVPVDLRDPVTHLFLDFAAGQVQTARAAGDLGVKPDFLANNLNRLDPRLRNVENEGIDRELFEQVYVDSLCILQVASDNRPLNCQ
jgi:serine/threonine-protein kinase